jgi:hypothetical protein
MLYKENNKLRDWKRKCIYSTYSPLSTTRLRLRCSNLFNPTKKISFGCAANRKNQRLISTPTYLWLDHTAFRNYDINPPERGYIAALLLVHSGHSADLLPTWVPGVTVADLLPTWARDVTVSEGVKLQRVHLQSLHNTLTKIHLFKLFVKHKFILSWVVMYVSYQA